MRWQSSTQIPGTPPPPRPLHCACDLAQPVAEEEPLNTSPKLLWLEGLWLLSSAGPSSLLFLFSFSPPPSRDSGQLGVFCFFATFFFCFFFPPLSPFSFSYCILNLKTQLALILICLGFIYIINSNHAKKEKESARREKVPGPGLYTKFGCRWREPAIPGKHIFFRYLFNPNNFLF